VGADPSNIRTFRKLPVVVHAIQFTQETVNEIMEWGRVNDAPFQLIPGYNSPTGKTYLRIPTLEGDHYATLGDWIICGVDGEFYPCKPTIFARTYEAAA
jgi:hypothetical protein